MFYFKKLLGSSEFFWFTLLSVCGAGCFMQEEPPPAAPTAQIQLIHNLFQAPGIEVLLDDDVIVEARSGEISDLGQLPVGEHSISFRLVGGSVEAFLSTEIIDFSEQRYVFAITGTLTDPLLLESSQRAPNVQGGEHTLKVLDLSESMEELTLFKGQESILDLPVEDRLSGFITVDASNNASLSLTYAEGGAAALTTVKMPSGEASLLVIRERNSYEMILLPITSTGGE